MRYIAPTFLLLAITLFLGSCSTISDSILFDLNPSEYTDGAVTVRPWFGDRAFLLRIENRASSTVTLHPESFVLVAPDGTARKLAPVFQSDVIPPARHTYLSMSGPVVFSVNPDTFVDRRPLGPSSFSGPQYNMAPSENRLEELRSQIGQTVELRFMYTLEGTGREVLARFTLADAQWAHDESQLEVVDTARTE